MSYWHRIEIECDIQAAHQLFLPYESPCNRPHGHAYFFKVAIGATKLDDNGMIIDFSKVKEVIRHYDHQNLNDFFKPTTAEYFSVVLYEQIKAILPEGAILLEVAVSETRNTWAKVNWRAGKE